MVVPDVVHDAVIVPVAVTPFDMAVTPLVMALFDTVVIPFAMTAVLVFTACFRRGGLKHQAQGETSGDQHDFCETSFAFHGNSSNHPGILQEACQS
jgi:hypothetical protein